MTHARYLFHMVGRILMVVALIWPVAGGAQEGTLELTPSWEYVSDRVMGGVSTGNLAAPSQGPEAVARLTGSVSLENNGGFVQMAFDLKPDGAGFDASAWRGVAFETRGNGETYEIRLRTDALTRPWQSFRAEFAASAPWTTIKIPFTGFEAHRTDATFDPSTLRRIGILAIGRVFEADVSIRGMALYK